MGWVRFVSKDRKQGGPHVPRASALKPFTRGGVGVGSIRLQRNDPGGQLSRSGGQKNDPGGQLDRSGRQKIEPGSHLSRSGCQKNDPGSQKNRSGSQLIRSGGQKNRPGTLTLGPCTSNGDRFSAPALQPRSATPAHRTSSARRHTNEWSRGRGCDAPVARQRRRARGVTEEISWGVRHGGAWCFPAPMFSGPRI